MRFSLFSEDRPNLPVDDVFRRVLWKKDEAALMCSSLDCKRVDFMILWGRVEKKLDGLVLLHELNF